MCSEQLDVGEASTAPEGVSSICLRRANLIMHETTHVYYLNTNLVFTRSYILAYVEMEDPTKYQKDKSCIPLQAAIDENRCQNLAVDTLGPIFPVLQM